MDDETARLLDRLTRRVTELEGAIANHRHHRDPQWDEWLRLADRNGRANYTDHFRSGAIPSVLAWQAGAPFGGAPATLDYSHRGTYLEVATAAGPNMLAVQPVAAYANKIFTARYTTGLTTEIGTRIDDGSDNNYAMMVLDPDGVGGYNVDFRYRAGGGAVTDVAGPQAMAGEFCTFSVYWYNTTPAIYGYLVGEHGEIFNLTGFNTPALAWTPDRAGIYLAGDGGAAGFCDWFYTTITV